MSSGEPERQVENQALTEQNPSGVKHGFLVSEETSSVGPVTLVPGTGGNRVLDVLRL
jgi:hypothetical protein